MSFFSGLSTLSYENDLFRKRIYINIKLEFDYEIILPYIPNTRLFNIII